MSSSKPFDVSRAMLRGPDTFERFRVTNRTLRLAAAGLRDDEELLVIERGTERLAFSIMQMAYHHVAQGELGGEPYLVAF
ncbi:MAG: hypothetical protein ACE5HT_15405 [Gemmatimonadales bacterium]